MSSLNRKNDEMYHLMKARTNLSEKEKPKVLPEFKQEIFRNLHELSGDDYQFELRKLRLYLKWDTTPRLK